MSVANRLERLLEESGVSFEVIDHPVAFTAQEEAAASHVAGRHWAKTVAVLVAGEPALAVVPATRRLDLAKMRRLVGTEDVEIAREAEFQDLYPDCDLGAMPPFGELYGQETFVDEMLREEERIAFHAGDHRTAIEMSYADFERLCEPVPANLSGPPRERV
ncbi:MAG: YbaK/EbsC family protein [Candidatus Palauibacterales bacterium]|jgi:Ala-tRNA(Pro) deacylase|nr:YbaK/EbsC family protein [Candidatus Palauibacterales bacterium]MDP2482620.1 YbaK/EbsC family protein [Candidatus Palauibacterales bacterium]